jgi:hypothetical protein
MHHNVREDTMKQKQAIASAPSAPSPTETARGNGKELGWPGRFREFVIAVNIDQVERLARVGMTPEDAIEDAQGHYRGGWEDHRERPDLTPVEYAAHYEHVVIWEGSRVVAVLVPEPSGLKPEMIVTRFDDPRTSPATGPAGANEPAIAIDTTATLPAEGDLTIEEARRIIAVGVVRGVVAHYHASLKRYEEAVKRCSDDRTLDRWVNLLSSARYEAEALLIRAIVTWHHGGDREKKYFNITHTGERRYFPACSVEVGGVTYAAVPDPSCEDMEVGKLRDDGCHAMTLVIIEPEAFADLDLDESGTPVSEYRERLD